MQDYTDFNAYVEFLGDTHFENANTRMIKRFYRDVDVIRGFEYDIQRLFWFHENEIDCACGSNMKNKFVYYIPSQFLVSQCVSCFKANFKNKHRCRGCKHKVEYVDILQVYAVNHKNHRQRHGNGIYCELSDYCIECAKRRMCSECRIIYRGKITVMQFMHPECMVRRYDRLKKKMRDALIKPMLNEYFPAVLSTVILQYVPGDDIFV
jgi:hypothetical protein